MIQQTGHDFILIKDGADQRWFAPSFFLKWSIIIKEGEMYKISYFRNNKKEK